MSGNQNDLVTPMYPSVSDNPAIGQFIYNRAVETEHVVGGAYTQFLPHNVASVPQGTNPIDNVGQNPWSTESHVSSPVSDPHENANSAFHQTTPTPIHQNTIPHYGYQYGPAMGIPHQQYPQPFPQYFTPFPPPNLCRHSRTSLF